MKKIEPRWAIVGIAFMIGVVVGLLFAVNPIRQAYFALDVAERATQDEMGPHKAFIALVQLQRLRARGKEELLESFEWQLDGGLVHIAEHPDMFSEVLAEGTDNDTSILGRAKSHRLKYPVVQEKHKAKIHNLLGIKDTESNNAMQPDG